MTVFLQDDPGDTGTGGVFPDRGFIDLIHIADGDMGLGQEKAAADLIDVIYERSLDGIWGVRLPLTDVWQRLSSHTIAEELRFLRD